MKRKAGSGSDGQGGVPLHQAHPYLALQCDETNHVISTKGKAKCDEDPDLSPGLDCCAICATKSDKLIQCATCHRVHYCSPAHQAADMKQHAAVCKLLATIDAAEQVELSQEEEARLVGEFSATAKVLSKAGSWLEVAPERFQGVLGVVAASRAHGASTAAAAEGAEGATPASGRKRPRTKSGDGHSPAPAPGSAAAAGTRPAGNGTAAAAAAAGAGGASPSPAPRFPAPSEIQPAEGGDPMMSTGTATGGPPATGDGAGPSAGPLAAASPGAGAGPSSSPGSDLRLAVEMAVASSYLTYPYTLAHALAGCASLTDVVMRVGAAGQALTVLVLGPSETAELGHMGAWKALAGCAPAGVVLQCVGPEVPASKHLTLEEVHPGIFAAFFQGEYAPFTEQMHGAAPSATPSATTAGGANGTNGGAEQAQARALLKLLPDMVVGYNMGLTCPDYDWMPTFGALNRVFKRKCAVPVAPGTQSTRQLLRLPWLVTSNTHVEAQFEEKVVREHGWGVSASVDRNPFTSLEPLQSGTLANDVYRKNAWLAVYELVRQAPASAARARGGNGLTQKIGRLVGKVVNALPSVRLPWRRGGPRH